MTFPGSKDHPTPSGHCVGEEPAEERLARFLGELRDALRHWAWEVLRDDHLAEDAIQDSVLRLLPAAPSLDAMPEEKRRSYLFTAVKNAAIDIHRQRSAKRRRDEAVGRDGNGKGAESPADDPRARELLERLLSQVPEKERVVLELVELEHLDLAEVASRLGLKRETARKRHWRGRQHLREALERRRAAEERSP